MAMNDLNSTLKALNGLRIVALVIQILYLFYAEISLTPVIIAILSLQTILLLISLLNRQNRLEQSHLYFFLLFDLLLFMGYILQTGGSSNPLISLSFLPLIIACLSFPRYWAFGVLLVAIGFYTFLLWSQPSHHHMDFNSHLIGMWGVYIISATLLFFVISKQVIEKRELDQKLSQLKSQRQRDEHLMSLGLAHADMAHQLNTPLASLVLIGENLIHTIDNKVSEERIKEILKEDLDLLQKQITVCSRISNDHLVKWQKDNLESSTVKINDFIDGVANDFRLLRPEIELSLANREFNCPVVITRGLKYAVLNLLDNAAKASLDNQITKVQLEVSRTKHELVINIQDFGTGFASEIKSLYGFEPNKNSNSMGMGSLLVTANLERAGARMEVKENPESDDYGTQALIFFPVAKEQI